MNIIVILIKIVRKVEFGFFGFVYGLAFKKKGKNIKILSPMFITPEYIECGDNILILKNARIQGIDKYQGVDFCPKITLEDEVTIQQNIHLTCANRVTIMSKVAIGANVTITDINHPYKNINIAIEEQPIEVSEVYIGEHSKIYNNSVILPGVRLGKHTVVGANSIVLSGNYPDFCVLAGAPATIVKKYDTKLNKWIKK
jgi:acetyltransferase-like isoleucine patch superfamily enzyme